VRLRDCGLVRSAILVAVTALVGGLATVAVAAADEFTAPGARVGEATTVTATADPEAGEFAHPRVDVSGNGAIACGGLTLRGSVSHPVLKLVEFSSIDLSPCTYLGMPARVSASSCALVVTGEGRGKLVSTGAGDCSLRLGVPGCTVSLGPGLLLSLGFHNTGSPREITALTESVGLQAAVVGAGCPTPGGDGFAEFEGYLLLQGARHGERAPFTVII
jgi:hypothetical protein